MAGDENEGLGGSTERVDTTHELWCDSMIMIP